MLYQLKIYKIFSKFSTNSRDVFHFCNLIVHLPLSVGWSYLCWFHSCFFFVLFIHLSHPKTEDFIRVICMSTLILEYDLPHFSQIFWELNAIILMLTDWYTKWKKHTVQVFGCISFFLVWLLCMNLTSSTPRPTLTWVQH